MVNPGIFHGSRLTFLLGELPHYVAAVANGTKEEFMKNVLRRYFKRFSPDLPHSHEPTEDELAAVDDNTPDVEPEVPDPSTMTQTEYHAAMKKLETRTNEILVRSGQIIRWFNYRQSKPNVFKAVAPVKSSDMKDPMFIMTCRLLGKSAVKPRKPIAYNVWTRDNRKLVEAALALAPRKDTARHDVGTDVKVKQELFEKQTREIQDEYKNKAEEEHKALLQEWTFNLTRPASTDPEARQVCFDGLTSFLQPILDLVAEFTGTRVMCLVGGPEPAARQINIVGLYSGTTKGPVKMNFAEAESKKLHEQVIPAFSDFLRKCYTPADVKAASLPFETTPLLSIVDAKDVTYCPASGDNYGPKPSHSSSSATIPSATPSTTPSTTSGDVSASKASTGPPVTQSSPMETDDGKGKGSVGEKRKKEKKSKTKGSGRPDSTKLVGAEGLSDSARSGGQPQASSSADPSAPSGPQDSVPSSEKRKKQKKSTTQDSGRPDPTKSGAAIDLPDSASRPQAPSSTDPAIPSTASLPDRNALANGPSVSTPPAPASSSAPSPPSRDPESSPLPSSPLNPRSPASSGWVTPAPTSPNDRLPPSSPPPPLSSPRTSPTSLPVPSSPPNLPLPPRPSSPSSITSPSVPSSPPSVSSPRAPSTPPSIPSPSPPRPARHDTSYDGKKPIKMGPPSKRRKQNLNAVTEAMGKSSERVPPISAQATAATRAVAKWKPASGAQRRSDMRTAIVPLVSAPATSAPRAVAKKRKPTSLVQQPSDHRTRAASSGQEATSSERPTKRRKEAEKENLGDVGQTKKRKGDDEVHEVHHSKTKRRKAMHDIVQPALEPSEITSSSSIPATASSIPATSPTHVSVPPPSVADLPPECKPGIRLTLEMATSVSWGPAWAELLRSWLAFEAAYGYAGNAHLSADKRPREIGDWIQRARKPHYRPTFDLDVFEESFWSWWIALQPDWRKIEQGTTSRAVEGNWDALDKPGTNGLASVIAALFFWGHRLGDDREAHSSWKLARDDVFWVIEQLCTQRSARRIRL